jgi:hypothetical protein
MGFWKDVYALTAKLRELNEILDRREEELLKGDPDLAPKFRLIY